MVKMKRTDCFLPRIFFTAYALLMLYLLFWQRSSDAGSLSYVQALHAHLNLIPLRTIRAFAWLMRQGIRHGSVTLIRIALVNLLGNILMFIPLGFFLPLLWPKCRVFRRFLPTAAGIILIVETVQLFTLLGRCDIDDLILNLPGAIMGYFIYRLTTAVRKRHFPPSQEIVHP